MASSYPRLRLESCTCKLGRSHTCRRPAQHTRPTRQQQCTAAPSKRGPINAPALQNAVRAAYACPYRLYAGNVAIRSRWAFCSRRSSRSRHSASGTISSRQFARVGRQIKLPNCCSMIAGFVVLSVHVFQSALPEAGGIRTGCPEDYSRSRGSSARHGQSNYQAVSPLAPE
jgi:hypothetical protein